MQNQPPKRAPLTAVNDSPSAERTIENIQIGLDWENYLHANKTAQKNGQTIHQYISDYINNCLDGERFYGDST